MCGVRWTRPRAVSIHKCVMASFIRPVLRKMATMVCVLIPDTIPPSQWGQQQTIVRVTRFDLCFKGILGKWTTRRWKQKHEGPAPQAGGILRTGPSSHTEETGRGGGKMGLDLRGTVKAELGWLAHNWTWVWKRERRQCFSSDNWLPFFSCEKAWRGTVT